MPAVCDLARPLAVGRLGIGQVDDVEDDEFIPWAKALLRSVPPR
jgi:hypothetical protein